MALGMKDIIEAQRLLWTGAPVVVQQTEETGGLEEEE